MRTAKVIEGKVVVSRNPCLHPGDIRVLTCISADEVRKRYNGKNPFFPDLINCLVFATDGLSVPPQCGGGDLDGDLYFVAWDKRLIPPKTQEPMVYDEEKKEQK